MSDVTERHHRRSVRLQDYDFASDGMYFITICTAKRECLFGLVDDLGNMQLNVYGEIVRDEWVKTPNIRPYVVLDEFTVMPNHFHGILFIMPPDDQSATQPVGDPVGARRVDRPMVSGDPVPVGAQRAAPLRGPRVAPGSLGAIVRGFKSAVTKRINELHGTPGDPVWQRNYYEHVIRNELVLNDIRLYIQTNPACWAEDSENPANVNRVEVTQ